MKKITFIGLFALLCVSCMSKPNSTQAPLTDGVAAPAPVTEPIDMSQVYTYQSAETVTIQPQDEEFYRRNVVTKAMGDDYIIYEYTNIRIDQIAALAARYCYETNQCTSAYLRDLYLNRNHKRRATFQCIDLASQ